uniref:Transcriptional regulator n=1 Tax=Parastrongyloides trichosuri TaxID=131310 RepID=A0A0N4ZLH1_PARTI
PGSPVVRRSQEDRQMAPGAKGSDDAGAAPGSLGAASRQLTGKEQTSSGEMT